MNANMKPFLAVLLLLAGGCCVSNPKPCDSGQGKELADGIVSRLASNGDVVVTLQPDRVIMIRQADRKGRLVSVGNMDGNMGIIAIGKEGKTPVSVDWVSSGSMRVVTTLYTETNSVMMMDLNGDGIPERRITRPKDGPCVFEEHQTTTWIEKRAKDKGTVDKSDAVQRQRQSQIDAVLEVIKQYKTNQCGPDVVKDAVRNAKLIHAREFAEPLVGIIDFAHVDARRDGGCDVPFEQFFPVVDALAQIGVPALEPIMELLKKEDVNSLKSQLGRRTLVLIYGSICVEDLEKRIATVDMKDRKILELQLNALKHEARN